MLAAGRTLFDRLLETRAGKTYRKPATSKNLEMAQRTADRTSPDRPHRSQHDERAESLRCCDVFANLSDRDLQRIVVVAEKVKVPAGRQFIVQDRTATFVDVLISGRALVLK